MSDPKWPMKGGRPVRWGDLTPAQKDLVLRAAWARYTDEQRDTDVTKELVEAP